MKIGIIGTGMMGGTLGRLWAQHGHSVMFGSRDPEKAQALADQFTGDTHAGSQEAAAQFGEVVVLAVPGSAAINVAKSLPLEGKIVIDLGNPMAGGRLA